MLCPDVSVILPFYHSELTLNRAIESIAKQTHKCFECVLVNNNANKKTLKIAHGWEKRDSRFKVVHEQKQGVMFASNYGVAMSRGRYIARMDADDWAYPEKLSKQTEHLNNHPETDVVGSIVEYVPHNNQTQGFARYVNWINTVVSNRDINLKRFIESPMVNPTAMWRREAGEKYGLYQKGDFPEDYEMWLRWLDLGAKMEKIDVPLLKWFDSSSRLTRTQDIYSDEAFYKIKTRYLVNWLKQNNPCHPHVSVWGASRISRRHTQMLFDWGIVIDSFIDVKKTRQLNQKIVYYQDVSLNTTPFVLVYMKHADIRSKISRFLEARGFEEGKNYLLIS